MRVGSAAEMPAVVGPTRASSRQDTRLIQPAQTASRETEFCAQRLWLERTAYWVWRPSNRLGRLDLVPPTYGIVEPFQAHGRLASPGRLAGGAEGIRTQSCKIAKRTRSFTIFQWPYRINQTSIVGDLRCAPVKNAAQSSLDRSVRVRGNASLGPVICPSAVIRLKGTRVALLIVPLFVR
jgi:hypothetical protein